MKKFLCPHCLEEHTLKTCNLMCSYHDNRGDDCAKHATGVKDGNGFIHRSEYKRCLKCHHAVTSLYCPQTEKKIPDTYPFGKALPFVFLGNSNTGKTCYVYMLLDEMRRKITHMINAHLDLGDIAENFRYEHIPLSVNGILPAVTLPNPNTSMMVSLRFFNKKHHIKGIANLTLYDSYGGDCTERAELYDISNLYKHVSTAEGIFLLIDPLQFMPVREKLMGKVRCFPDQTDPSEILSNAVRVIRKEKNIPDKNKIDIPLAIVLTKTDLLDTFDILPSDSCLFREPDILHKQKEVLPDQEGISQFVRNLLEQWGVFSDEMNTLLSNFSKVSFFGVSALGENPYLVNNCLTVGKPKPKRVLDPLLWMLMQNKIIKTVKK